MKDGYVVDEKGRRVTKYSKVKKYKEGLDPDTFDCLMYMMVDS